MTSNNVGIGTAGPAWHGTARHGTALALALALAWASIPLDGAVEFVSDNRSTTLILNNARARTDAVCGGIVQTLAGLFQNARATACATWAPGQLNGIADLASRTADPVGLLSTLTRAFRELHVSVQSLASSPLAQIPALDATRSARLEPCRSNAPR